MHVLTWIVAQKYEWTIFFGRNPPSKTVPQEKLSFARNLLYQAVQLLQEASRPFLPELNHKLDISVCMCI